MADKSTTPRHGRHSAAGRHAMPQVDAAHAGIQTEAVSVGEPAQLPHVDPDAIPQIAPITDGDQETSMGDAPRPIGVDPEETGSFECIGASEGARLTTRANASETASFRMENARPVEAVRMSTAGRPKVERHEAEVQTNKRVFAIIAVAGAVVMAIVGTLLVRALVSVEGAGEKVVLEQTQAAGDEGIEYRDTTYRITEQEGGKYALTSTSVNAEGTSVLCEFEGTPVTLILYEGAFVIPENLADGTWDLIAYPLGGVVRRVVDAEGNSVTGEGEIAEARLDGSSVVVTTADGARTTVSLV